DRPSAAPGSLPHLRTQGGNVSSGACSMHRCAPIALAAALLIPAAVRAQATDVGALPEGPPAPPPPPGLESPPDSRPESPPDSPPDSPPESPPDSRPESPPDSRPASPTASPPESPPESPPLSPQDAATLALLARLMNPEASRAAMDLL